MRLTTFFIDDGKFDESIVEPFQAVYIVFGDNKTPSRYILKDWNWNDIDINTLNPYQRGLLYDCLDFFQGTKGIPWGVVKVNNQYIEKNN